MIHRLPNTCAIYSCVFVKDAFKNVMWIYARYTKELNMVFLPCLSCPSCPCACGAGCAGRVAPPSPPVPPSTPGRPGTRGHPGSAAAPTTTKIIHTHKVTLHVHSQRLHCFVSRIQWCHLAKLDVCPVNTCINIQWPVDLLQTLMIQACTCPNQ